MVFHENKSVDWRLILSYEVKVYVPGKGNNRKRLQWQGQPSMRRKCHPEYRASRGDYALHKYREFSDVFGSMAKKRSET